MRFTIVILMLCLLQGCHTIDTSTSTVVSHKTMNGPDECICTDTGKIVRERKIVSEQEPRVALALKWIPFKIPFPQLIAVPGTKTITTETEHVMLPQGGVVDIPGSIKIPTAKKKPKLIVTPRVTPPQLPKPVIPKPVLTKPVLPKAPVLPPSPWPMAHVTPPKRDRATSPNKKTPQVRITSVSSAPDPKTRVKKQQQTIRGLRDRIRKMQQMCEQAEKHLLDSPHLTETEEVGPPPRQVPLTESK